MQHDIRKRFDDVRMLPDEPWNTRQTFLRVFIDDTEKSEFTAFCCLIPDKVENPDIILMLCAQPDTSAVVRPYPAAFRLFAWQLQSFLVPDMLHVHIPKGMLRDG